jgi:hypothetical protein
MQLKSICDFYHNACKTAYTNYYCNLPELREKLVLARLCTLPQLFDTNLVVTLHKIVIKGQDQSVLFCKLLECLCLLSVRRIDNQMPLRFAAQLQAQHLCLT